jgi:hypothetical protein
VPGPTKLISDESRKRIINGILKKNNPSKASTVIGKLIWYIQIPSEIAKRIERPAAATGSNIASMTIPIARRVFVMTVCREISLRWVETESTINYYGN